MTKAVSVIIPVFNEEKVIGECINSLTKQDYKPLEVIIVDDGSTDNTVNIVNGHDVKILKQNHSGPGSARNLGAQNSNGEILVFVDADMTFDKNFISDLIKPILKGKTIGTFSKNELVKNRQNIWSRCWNINRNVPPDRMLPRDYPDEAPVFRAILKKEFIRVGGFTASGEYTDDWSLSRKLGQNSTLAKGAIYYHSNPSSLGEVWKQARWIGKNEFISGTSIRRLRSLFFYNLALSIVIGIFKSIKNLSFSFLIFKILYDSAIVTSVLRSFFKEAKFK